MTRAGRYWWAWGLLFCLLWFALISYLTRHPSANQASTSAFIYELLLPVSKRFHINAVCWTEYINTFFRSAAHVFMFGCLGLLMYIALVPSLKFVRTYYMLTLLAVAILGIADELHQSYVPGRFPRGIDVAKDLSGAVVFLHIAFHLRKRFGRSVAIEQPMR